MTATKLSGERRPLVLGMGVTGLSVARWCARQGITAVFADSRAVAPARAAIADLLPNAAQWNGDLPNVLPTGCTELIVSPGVPLDLPVIAQAQAQGLPVLSDIDLFMAESGLPVLGVTGSNGKSTVTTLVTDMLNAAGLTAVAGGNLGVAALDLLEADAAVAVLELSSFQLERSAELPLQAAALLNLSPDHLDQHGDLASYRRAKQRIYSRCQCAIVNRDEPELAATVPAQLPQVGFTLNKPSPEDWGVISNADGQWIARGSFLVMPVADLQVAGRHNVQNVLAAFALATTQDVPLDGLIAGARLFAGLPHRMQKVASADGIVWVDDSKATNAAAAIASIEAVTGRVVLIAGGDAKGAELTDLARCIEDRDVLAILLGKDRASLQQVLADACPTLLADDMAAAVRLAADHAAPGDTVLLAPACSSLDMFTDFSARGEAFAAAVGELQS